MRNDDFFHSRLVGNDFFIILLADLNFGILILLQRFFYLSDFLLVLCVGSWLYQVLDVFLLSMCDVILDNQLVKPVYNQVFDSSFWTEFDCSYSKDVFNPIQVSGRRRFKQRNKGWQSLILFTKRLSGKYRKRRRRGKKRWLCL